MAARGVSVLKFVGTVSLGVLTGLSYTLSTLTIPALLTLPSARSAARAFDALTTSASRHARALASFSSSAFALAYLLSPRPLRHPYLLYVSALITTSHLAASDLLAPYLLVLGPVGRAGGAGAGREGRKVREREKEREREREREREKRAAAARARMEASYEVLGAAGSDATSEGSAGEEGEGAVGAGAGAGVGGGEEEVDVNGEEVRAEVEVFLKKQIVRSAVAGLAFLLSVVGIWGDGVAPVYGQAVIIEV